MSCSQLDTLFLLCAYDTLLVLAALHTACLKQLKVMACSALCCRMTPLVLPSSLTHAPIKHAASGPPIEDQALYQPWVDFVDCAAASPKKISLSRYYLQVRATHYTTMRSTPLAMTCTISIARAASARRSMIVQPLPRTPPTARRSHT